MIALALEGTTLNIIVHGFDGEGDKRVTLQFNLATDAFEIVVTDRAPPYTPDKANRLRPPEYPEVYAEEGKLLLDYIVAERRNADAF